MSSYNAGDHIRHDKLLFSLINSNIAVLQNYIWTITVFSKSVHRIKDSSIIEFSQLQVVCNTLKIIVCLYEPKFCIRKTLFFL